MKSKTHYYILRIVGFIIGITGFFLLYKKFGVDVVCIISLIFWGNNVEQFAARKLEDLEDKD